MRCSGATLLQLSHTLLQSHYCNSPTLPTAPGNRTQPPPAFYFCSWSRTQFHPEKQEPAAAISIRAVEATITNRKNFSVTFHHHRRHAWNHPCTQALLGDSCPAPAAKSTLCDCMEWKQELKQQNEQNQDPVLLHSTSNYGHTFLKSVLFQTKIGFHTQMTLHQDSKTEMTFSSVISILAEV